MKDENVNLKFDANMSVTKDQEEQKKKKIVPYIWFISVAILYLLSISWSIYVVIFIAAPFNSPDILIICIVWILPLCFTTLLFLNLLHYWVAMRNKNDFKIPFIRTMILLLGILWLFIGMTMLPPIGFNSTWGG